MSFSALIAPLLYVAAMLPVAAQTIYTGELTGNVTDPSGKIIARAMIDLTSGATGEKSSIATGGTGEFRFPLLRPGPYTLAVSAAGFETKTQRTTVELGQSSNLAIQLGIEAKKEDVFVTGQAPLLQSNNANLATTFNQQELEDLPNPGNDLTVFAFTAPGDLGNIPRNSFRSPGYFDTDLNVYKTFALAEKYRLNIGASLFNILNHPNFSPPQSIVNFGAFGQIQSTASQPTGPYGGGGLSGRVIQTLIKFSF